MHTFSNTSRDNWGKTVMFKIMSKKMLFGSIALFGLMSWSSRTEAHCQVPCGIYRDHARVLQMEEDITTISKAVDQIALLAAKQDAQSKNQLVRWINTKEHHAEQIMRTIADYFMAQKITPVATGSKQRTEYLEQLSFHHQVMVAAMICKQSSDQQAVKGLERALSAIKKYWRHKK